MYTISTIKPAGEDWFEVVISGPLGSSLPMKQMAGDQTIEDIRIRAQAWCDLRNLDWGFVTPVKMPGPTDKYRRGCTINWDAKMERQRKRLMEESGDD